MNDNIAILLVLVVSISAAVTLVLSSAWMKRLRPVAPGATALKHTAHLAAENAALRDQVARLERQLGIEDRIISGSAERTSRDIERLR